MITFAEGLVSFCAFLSLLIWDLCPFCHGYNLLPKLSYFRFLFVFSMSSVCSGCYELTEFVSNHIFCNIYRHMSSSIMNCDCMSNHLREDCGTAGPGFDYLFVSCSVHSINLFSKLSSANGPFFNERAILNLLFDCFTVSSSYDKFVRLFVFLSCL